MTTFKIPAASADVSGRLTSRENYVPASSLALISHNRNISVLYTINDRNVFITVGNQTNYWQDNEIFIFDDTLRRQS